MLQYILAGVIHTSIGSTEFLLHNYPDPPLAKPSDAIAGNDNSTTTATATDTDTDTDTATATTSINVDNTIETNYTSSPSTTRKKSDLRRKDPKTLRRSAKPAYGKDITIIREITDVMVLFVNFSCSSHSYNISSLPLIVPILSTYREWMVAYDIIYRTYPQHEYFDPHPRFERHSGLFIGQ